MRESLLLIDCMTLVHRSYWAFRGLHSESGTATGAIYGFLKQVHRLYQVAQRVVFCWDGGLPGDALVRNWRYERYPNYKCNRRRDGGDEHYVSILGQCRMLRKAVDLLKYDQIGVGGLEADDVIGILSRQWPGAVIIYSNDHDMYQLLEQGRVEVFCPDGKERAGLSGCKRIDQQGVEREYGVPIKHWPRYLALGGDTSDDVKPLLGVGPKGAARLVQEGARPDWPFRKHDCAFRKKYRWYESAWVKVQHAYEVVCIPRRASDARIVHLTQGARLRPRERGSVDEAAVAGFTTFCADLDLVDFLSIRRDFFYGSACSVD